MSAPPALTVNECAKSLASYPALAEGILSTALPLTISVLVYTMVKPLLLKSSAVDTCTLKNDLKYTVLSCQLLSTTFTGAAGAIAFFSLFYTWINKETPVALFRLKQKKLAVITIVLKIVLALAVTSTASAAAGIYRACEREQKNKQQQQSMVALH